MRQTLQDLHILHLMLVEEVLAGDDPQLERSCTADSDQEFAPRGGHFTGQLGAEDVLGELSFETPPRNLVETLELEEVAYQLNELRIQVRRSRELVKYEYQAAKGGLQLYDGRIDDN